MHYISVPPESPNDWVLKSDLLGFTAIEGNHGGANTAATIMKVLDRYNLREKLHHDFQINLYNADIDIQLGWVTGDNVSTNDTAARCIQQAKNVNRSDRPWKARQRRGRQVLSDLI